MEIVPCYRFHLSINIRLIIPPKSRFSIVLYTKVENYICIFNNVFHVVKKIRVFFALLLSFYMLYFV